MIDISNAKIELTLQIDIAVIFSLKSEVVDIEASEVTNISNAEIILTLQIDIVVILSLESDVSSLSISFLQIIIILIIIILEIAKRSKNKFLSSLALNSEVIFANMFI